MQYLQNNSTLQSGKYKISKVLGQGGFGITYLAKQNVSIEGPLGKINAEIEVTVKEFFMKDLCNRDDVTSRVSVPSTGSAELVAKFRQKFKKEAQNISSLNHPNIIKVLDVFEENGTAYYVMEYINGGSLGDMIKHKGTLSEKETLYYTGKIASALQYIHSKNMNHLDIKPANVLLRQNGDVVLIDFGLSKNYDISGEQTTSTPIGVSVGYAPIEQSRIGGVGTFSPATDIYSLGATMFKMLTGKVPPEASTIMDDGLPDFPSNTSERIKHCIVKSMEPRRRDRFQSIEEFLSFLNADNSTSSENVFSIGNQNHYKEEDLGTYGQENDLGLNNLMSYEDLDKEEECTILVNDTVARNSTNEIEIETDEYVDLGLSVKWCSKNFGSMSPEDYGDFFTWGDSDGSIQDRFPKKFLGNMRTVPANISGTEYDICRTQLCEGYRMPSYKEWKELIAKCRWTRYIYNDVNGYAITGPSGRTIFIPESGRKHAGQIMGRNERGSYWSATRRGGSEYAYHVYFDSKEIGLYCNPYYQYRTIRAVFDGHTEV